MKQLLARTGSADSTIISEAGMAMAEKFNAGLAVSRNNNLLAVERESHGLQDYCYEIPYSKEALVSNPHRVIVAGTSGSGKTHLAARIGSALRIPHIEIDALHRGPGWNKRSTFESEVEQSAKTPQWVTEWQYSSVRPLLAKRANLLVRLDLSRTRVMSQVIERTLFRFLRRE